MWALSILLRGWHALTDAPATLTDPALRRSSQLLGSGLVIMTVVFLAVDTVYLLTEPAYHPPYYGYVFLLSAYLLNRAAHYRAAVSCVLTMFLLVPLVHVARGEAMFPQVSLSYLSLAPSLGAILLPMRGVALLCLANLSMLVLAPYLLGESLPRSLLVGPLSLTTTSGLLALLGMYHRGLLERDRLRELGESESRLRMALEAARMGIFDVDAITGKAITTPGVSRMLGLDDGSMLDSYARYRQSIHPEDRPGVELALEQPTGPEGEVLQLSHRVIWPDGSVHWLDASGRAIFDRDGKVIRRMGTLVDVTEKKLLEEQLRQVQKLEAVGRLAGGVAHDFNNLLTVILGNIELLKLQKGEKPLHDIEQAALSAATLTQQLLAFSRRAAVNPQVVVLNEVLSTTANMLERIIGEDIQTQLELSPEAWRVRADEGQIQQIVLNLATNARDAMPSGGLLILATANIETFPEESPPVEGMKPGEYVMLAVTDTGSGMAPETKSRIFEPFFTTKPAGKGTGLGLAMVFGVVIQSDGAIHVESSPGEGTTFRLYFPRAQQEAAAPRESLRALSAGHETILLVEDEKAVREVTTTMLELAGYTVWAVNSPQTARQLWTQSKLGVDMLISDVVMPDGSGHELARLLRIERPELPVLFITGYDPSARTDTYDAPTLRKPFTREQLLRSVRGCLDRRTSRRRGALGE
jgi:two-component system cell cycle sensor histidine kinase/response regulator CckA